jgi:hypothetical protein
MDPVTLVVIAGVYLYSSTPHSQGIDMNLAIIMFLAMTPIFWWAITEAIKEKKQIDGRPSSGSHEKRH